MSALPARSAPRLDVVLPDGEWQDEPPPADQDARRRRERLTWRSDERPQTGLVIGYVYDEGTRLWLAALP